MLEYLVIIQARLNSTRLPGKCLMTVGGIPMVKRVWDAAKQAGCTYTKDKYKVIVAWPERYPDLDENNVLGRFRRISAEFPSRWIIRLTSDCPLLKASDIYGLRWEGPYGANHRDGHDVQIFDPALLYDPRWSHTEHVIADFNTPSTGLSVNTIADLERVRALCKTQ